MSNIVYVITKGCYSDYHICAVTMDIDRARHLQKLFSNYEKANIEEFYLDETQVEHLYGIEMSKRTHSFIQLYRDEYDNPDFTGQIDESREAVTVWVMAKDENSAIKAAQDRYAQYRAEREGII